MISCKNGKIHYIYLVNYVLRRNLQTAISELDTRRTQKSCRLFEDLESSCSSNDFFGSLSDSLKAVKTVIENFTVRNNNCFIVIDGTMNQTVQTMTIFCNESSDVEVKRNNLRLDDYFQNLAIQNYNAGLQEYEVHGQWTNDSTVGKQSNLYKIMLPFLLRYNLILVDHLIKTVTDFSPNTILDKDRYIELANELLCGLTEQGYQHCCFNGKSYKLDVINIEFYNLHLKPEVFFDVKDKDNNFVFKGTQKLCSELYFTKKRENKDSSGRISYSEMNSDFENVDLGDLSEETTSILSFVPTSEIHTVQKKRLPSAPSPYTTYEKTEHMSTTIDQTVASVARLLTDNRIDDHVVTSFNPPPADDKDFLTRALSVHKILSKKKVHDMQFCIAGSPPYAEMTKDSLIKLLNVLEDMIFNNPAMTGNLKKWSKKKESS